jgi:signal transduction histidine kinase
LRESPRAPAVLLTRSAAFAAVGLSLVAVAWTLAGRAGYVDVSSPQASTYPMQWTSALCVVLLAGAILANSWSHPIPALFGAFATAVVALGAVLRILLSPAQTTAEYPLVERWFSHLYSALPIALSFLSGSTAVSAVAVDRQSPNRAVFAAIAAIIAATLGTCGLLNSVFAVFPANAAFEGEVALDAAAAVVLLAIAILCQASSPRRQTSEAMQFLTPLLVAAIGTVGSFVMWRFLLEERTGAVAYQTSNAAATLKRVLDLELRQMLRQLRLTADEPNASSFSESEVQRDVEVVWTDSKSLLPDESYLRGVVGQLFLEKPLAVVPGRAGHPELVLSAPKKDGAVRVAAFALRDFLNPTLKGVLGSNFTFTFVQKGQAIYRYPQPSVDSGPSAGVIVTALPQLNGEMRLEPRLDLVRYGGTASLHLALVMGLMASFLLAFSVHLLHASRARLAEVQEARAVLELEVEHRRNAERELDRKAKLLQGSNTELQEFAHVVSHDLQEPLRTIRGFAQLVSRRYSDKLDLEGHEFLQFITDSSVRMHDMIQGLLAYSRVTHSEGHEEVFPLSEAVEWAQGNLTLAIEECGARIEIGDLPQVKANRLQFCQLMQNLIGNALKYRGPEKPVIRVSCRNTGTESIVTVSDNGVGIGPEFQERIFGLFKRAHGKEYPGTGVGLALCKKIVERHGGQIWVESTLGRGSQFHFRVPAV